MNQAPENKGTETTDAQVTKPIETTKSLPEPPTPADGLKSPVVKKVVLRRRYNGRWEVEFEGPIKRSDINHLVKRLRIDFSRSKRDARIKSRKEQRLKEIKNEQ